MSNFRVSVTTEHPGGRKIPETHYFDNGQEVERYIERVTQAIRDTKGHIKEDDELTLAIHNHRRGLTLQELPDNTGRTIRITVSKL